MSFAKRVAKLERLMTPKRRRRVVIRYQNAGDPTPSGTQEEVDENTHVIVVQYTEGPSPPCRRENPSPFDRGCE